VTEGGKVKRTAASEFAVRKAKFAAVKLREGDKVAAAFPVDDAQALYLVSRQGLAIRIPAEVPVQGRVSTGVAGMAVQPGDAVMTAFQGPPDEGELLFVTGKGMGMRVLAADFPPQGRGGKGVKAVTLKKGDPCLAAALVVTDPYDVCLIREGRGGETCERLNSEEFRLERRASAGRVVVVLGAEERVSGIVKNSKMW